MKKILSTVISFALLLNTFTTLVSADESEMVGGLSLSMRIMFPIN